MVYDLFWLSELYGPKWLTFLIGLVALTSSDTCDTVDVHLIWVDRHFTKTDLTYGHCKVDGNDLGL